MPASTPGRAWWGVIVLFLVHGLVVSSWISRIPAIQAALHLNNAVLGITLLSAAIGAVCTIPLIGYLVSRFGSRPVTLISSCFFCLSVVPLALAVNAWTLAAALFLYGALAAAMDVSMNAQGVEVEKRLGTPTMSRFHAMFSGGAMAGAALGGSIASHGTSPLFHFIGNSAANCLAVLAIAPLLIPDAAQTGDAAQHPHRLPLRQTPKVLLALSAIGFCLLLSEGAVADWTGVYLRQVMQAGQGTAALGFAVFSATMAIFRFLGDFITMRFGPLRTVRWGCIIAGVGLILALLAPSAPLSLPGFGISGIGMSVVIPLVFGGGGRVKGISPGAGIATVTGIGYIGFIVGPPTIGLLAQASTLRLALLFVVACCFLGAWLAGFMRSLDTEA